MAKRSFRTLYEMMRSERDVVSPGAPSAPEPTRTGEAMWRLLSPGHVIRVPTGYLLIGIAAIVFLLAIAYMLGARHARRAADASLAQYRQESGQIESLEPVVDPLREETTFPPAASRTNDILPIEKPFSPRGAAAGSAESGGSGGVAAPRQMGPIESDPRRAGRWYMVIAETRRGGALRLAEFCRSEGLEAYAVPVQNSSRVRVILLPGLTTQDGPERAKVDTRIRAIGRRWKSQSRGNSDLADAYPMRHGG